LEVVWAVVTETQHVGAWFSRAAAFVRVPVGAPPRRRAAQRQLDARRVQPGCGELEEYVRQHAPRVGSAVSRSRDEIDDL
jgi:hypothetical protein